MTDNHEKGNQIDEVYRPKGNPLPNKEMPEGTKILGEPADIERQPLPNNPEQDKNILQENDDGI